MAVRSGCCFRGPGPWTRASRGDRARPPELTTTGRFADGVEVLKDGIRAELQLASFCGLEDSALYLAGAEAAGPGVTVTVTTIMIKPG